MPAAPPCLTLKPFSTRPLPPRWQATILPAKIPGGAGASQSTRLYGAAEDSTTGSGPAPAVMEAPSPVNLSPLAAVSVSVLANSRVWVEAATVVTHGERWFAVEAPGPSLPAEAATNTPAAYASRNASSTGSVDGSVPPEIEKLMTLTPSRTAWPTARVESELKQPAGPQTLYSITQAPGAMPASGPRSTPKTGAEATGLPAEVEVVW